MFCVHTGVSWCPLEISSELQDAYKLYLGLSPKNLDNLDTYINLESSWIFRSLGVTGSLWIVLRTSPAKLLTTSHILSEAWVNESAEIYSKGLSNLSMNNAWRNANPMQNRFVCVGFVSVPVSSMMVSYDFRSVAMFLVMLGSICHGHGRLCYHLSLWRAKHAVPGARISLAAAWCETGMDIDWWPSRVGSVKSATVNLNVSFIGRKADSLRHLSPGWLESSQLPSLRMRLLEAIGNEMKVAPQKKVRFWCKILGLQNLI